MNKMEKLKQSKKDGESSNAKEIVKTSGKKIRETSNSKKKEDPVQRASTTKKAFASDNGSNENDFELVQPNLRMTKTNFDSSDIKKSIDGDAKKGTKSKRKSKLK